jgi:hypothetical protein
MKTLEFSGTTEFDAALARQCYDGERRRFRLVKKIEGAKVTFTGIGIRRGYIFCVEMFDNPRQRVKTWEPGDVMPDGSIVSAALTATGKGTIYIRVREWPKARKHGWRLSQALRAHKLLAVYR